MIDSEGLFSPTGVSKGEPSGYELVYLSLRRNGMVEDVDNARMLEKISFYASLSSDPIGVAVRKSVKYEFATVGFGITKDGLPFAMLVPMSSLLSRTGIMDCAVRAVTLSAYWEYVSLNAVAEFRAGIPLSDDWKADFPLMDEESNLIEGGRLRIYAFGDIILANGFDGEMPCAFVSAEGEIGLSWKLDESHFVDGEAVKVYSDRYEYKDSIKNGIVRLSSYLRSSRAARNRLTGADCCVYRIVASKTAPIVVQNLSQAILAFVR